MKVILLLLDGLGDRAYPALEHRTPLQAADTPNLDRLAQLGSNGLFHPSLCGQCLPSETAHYLLFGYRPEDFPGRGLLEAVGEGVAFEDEDALSLAHLVSVQWRGKEAILLRGRKDLEGDAEELGELYAAIRAHEAEGIRFRLEQTRRNDAILVMSGPVSPHVSDSDPMVRGRAMARVLPLSGNPEPDRAGQTARALNAYLQHCHRRLAEHRINRRRTSEGLPPADFLATQRCGRRVLQRPFRRCWGLSGVMLASGSMYAGLAREIGLDFVPVTDSGDPGTDIRARIKAALGDAVHDFIHVHTKVPDEAAHRGDPRLKQEAISALDVGLKDLVEVLEAGTDLVVAVTADHSTPSVSPLIHSGEPVPLLMAGTHLRRDRVEQFDEVSAAAGCLGLIRGRELMLMLLNYADRSMLTGHRLGKEETPYFPNQYEPFERRD